MRAMWFGRIVFAIVAVVLCFQQVAFTRRAAAEYDVVAPSSVRSDYAFTTFDAPGAAGETSIYDINDSGEMVGYFYGTDGLLHGFIRHPDGTTIQIDASGSWGTAVQGINNLGDVVGYYYPICDCSGYGSYPPYLSFLYSHDGVFTTLPEYPGTSMRTIAEDINDAGQIAGHYVGWEGFLLENGAFAPFGYSVLAINNAGAFAGHTEGSRGFISTNASYEEFDAPGASYTVVWGLSNIGEAVGSAGFFPGYKGFMRDAAGTFHEVVVPGAVHTIALGINSAGTVVGHFQDVSGAFHGFIATLSAGDATPPSVACASPDGLWHATNASLACTASDSGSGLADAADASFTLTTIVAAGSETANASTDSRTVCDVAGNCTTVGPFAGNKIDRRAPSIIITAPASATFTVGQTVAASYACADAGSGVATCAGSVASGTSIDTTAVGSHTFAVTATDAAGNTTTSIVSYTVTYAICALFDQTKANKAGSTVPIKLNLCDAAGANVSNAAVSLTATGVYMVSTNAPGPLNESGNANADYQFRFAGGSYIFNLSLKDFSQGTYELVFTAAGDPAPHSVQFQVR